MILCVIHRSLIILISAVLSVATDKSGVTRPDNIAALAGSTVVFGCTSSKANNQTRWDFYPHGVNQPRTVFNGERIDPNFSDRFTVNVTSCRRQRCDLTIRNVRPRDAGFYVCFEPSSSDRKSAALVVLHSDPLCHTNLTLPHYSVYWWDFVEVDCSVNFSGTWKPLFHCAIQGTDDTDVESTDVTSTGVAYRRSFAALSFAKVAVLECSMQFEVAVQPTASLPELIDSPIPPDYTYYWRSHTIRIIDDRFPSRASQATPTVHDVTTASATKKMTLSAVAMTTEAAKPTPNSLANIADDGMKKSESNSPEVIYITMALIGLLAICVFVIAGLVLVVAKRRREAARRSLPVVPKEFSSVSRRPPRCGDSSYTPCRAEITLSAEHYATIDDSAGTWRPESGNCGQHYQDIDELIRREPAPAVDHPYLNPVVYNCAGPLDPARSDPSSELISQTDNGPMYASPTNANAKPTPTKR